MKTIDKFTPLNAITDVWEPVYHSDEVYVDINKIKRSKLDIKLRFAKVNDTSGYAGDWFIRRTIALKHRKRHWNNGRECIVIPFSEFEKIQVAERSHHDW